MALKNSSGAPTVVQDVGTGKGTGWYTSDGQTVIDELGNVVAPVTPDSVGLTHNHILVGDSSDVGADVAMSGDATIADTGALTIANSAVTTAKINAAAVTGAKLVTGVGYFQVAKATNGTSPVNVIAATVPFSCVITGVFLVSEDTTTGNITVANTAGTVATIAKGSVSGVLVGAASLANTSVTAGNTLTIVSSSAGNANVFITFTVA